jgi:hypothetical protein
VLQQEEEEAAPQRHQQRLVDAVHRPSTVEHGRAAFVIFLEEPSDFYGKTSVGSG